jgi:ABC-type transporter Mla subunit MlaD
MLNNISGIGQVQEALAETNKLLAEVLAELRRTNDEQLARVADLLDRQG